MTKLKKAKVVPAPGTNHPFPIDTLRYDRCSPYHKIDSAAIVASVGSGRDRPMDPIYVIKTVPSPWTAERWRSFGWILSEET